ncbi:hypothetical protein TWF718_001916 [Orbilia javanica]|uniref:Uncharacterized protein n=1 Tax=Orbilia javanica TaxID=47235 RepID=A0AAN8MZM3_9PEZI
MDLQLLVEEIPGLRITTRALVVTGLMPHPSTRALAISGNLANSSDRLMKTRTAAQAPAAAAVLAVATVAHPAKATGGMANISSATRTAGSNVSSSVFQTTP